MCPISWQATYVSYRMTGYPAPYMQTTCRQLQTLADTLTFCTERVWGRPPGYVTLWDPKKHFSEENSSPGGPGATPHHAYSHAVPT